MGKEEGGGGDGDGRCGKEVDGEAFAAGVDGAVGGGEAVHGCSTSFRTYRRSCSETLQR